MCLGPVARNLDAWKDIRQSRDVKSPFPKSCKSKKGSFKGTTLREVQPCLVIRRNGQDGLKILCNQGNHHLSLMVPFEDLRTLYRYHIFLNLYVPVFITSSLKMKRLKHQTGKWFPSRKECLEMSAYVPAPARAHEVGLQRARVLASPSFYLSQEGFPKIPCLALLGLCGP